MRLLGIGVQAGRGRGAHAVSDHIKSCVAPKESSNFIHDRS